MEFNVGDYIVMKRSADFYYFTKYKSTGVVIEVIDDQVFVDFDYLSGSVGYDRNSFWVDIEHCKLTKRLSQQEKVCAKIKQMEARWLKYQERKTCHV